jgi:hypothetical protein
MSKFSLGFISLNNFILYQNKNQIYLTNKVSPNFIELLKNSKKTSFDLEKIESSLIKYDNKEQVIKN